MNEDTEVITIDIDEEKLKASVDRVIEESINKDVVVDILPCEEDVIDTFEVLSVKKVEHLRSELEYVITSNNLDEESLSPFKVTTDRDKGEIEWFQLSEDLIKDFIPTINNLDKVGDKYIQKIVKVDGFITEDFLLPICN